MRNFLPGIIAFLFCIVNIGFAQIKGYKMSQWPLFENKDVKIEIGYKIPKKPCDSVASQKAKFAIFVTNKNGLYYLYDYLNWKIDYVNCNNDIIEKTVSINVKSLDEGLNSNLDWDFEATQIEKDFYDVRNENFEDNTLDKTKSKAFSVAPDSIQGNKSIVLGETITLKVVGGALTRDAKWVWYSGSCPGGIREGEGLTLVKTNLTKSTVFYVRGEGLKSNTSPVSFQVVVDNNSRPADGIEGRTQICRSNINEKTMLYVVGGKKGLNAKWVWYVKAAGARVKQDEGDTIYVTPQQTTTYYVQAEGPSLNPTTPVYHTIMVVDPSIVPSDISVSQPNKCAGKPVMLTVVGGRLSKGADWVWRSVSESNYAPHEEGYGSTITVYPDEKTTYTVSAEDEICPVSEEKSKEVYVKMNSVEASGISVVKEKRNKYILTLMGGSLGENAQWVWYKNDCNDGNKLASNENSINYKSRKGESNIVSVRAEGECDTSYCISTNANDIVWQKKGTLGYHQNFWYINGGAVAQNTELINNLVFTLGCRWVYASIKLPIEDGLKYSYDDIGIIEPTPTGTIAQETGKLYYSKSSITGGFLMGGGVFRLYVGGGTCKYQDVKEYNLVNTSTGSTQSTIYARKQNGLINGIEAEGGILLRMGGIVLMGGTSAVFVQNQTTPFMDYQLSIGFRF